MDSKADGASDAAAVRIRVVCAGRRDAGSVIQVENRSHGRWHEIKVIVWPEDPKGNFRHGLPSARSTILAVARWLRLYSGSKYAGADVCGRWTDAAGGRWIRVSNSTGRTILIRDLPGCGRHEASRG